MQQSVAAEYFWKTVLPDDQVEACRRVFASDARWTVVREATLKRARGKASLYGVGTRVTPSSRALSRVCCWRGSANRSTALAFRPGLWIGIVAAQQKRGTLDAI
jgi:hypothetical protein